MANTPAAVFVKVLRTATVQHPPETRIEYVVSNASSAPIWLVSDGWPIWRQHGRSLRLSFARGKMQPSVQPFGYFPPATRKILPSRSSLVAYEWCWPLPLSRLWNTASKAAPVPGKYQLRIQVGYGLTAKPARVRLKENIEAPVLRWQHVAISDPHSLLVPAYEVSRTDP